jgi:hypothetical protein
MSSRAHRYEFRRCTFRDGLRRLVWVETDLTPAIPDDSAHTALRASDPRAGLCSATAPSW